MDKFPGYLTYKCRKVWFRTKIVVVHNKVWVTVFIGVDYCFATSQGCSIFGILFASKMSAGGTLWTGVLREASASQHLNASMHNEGDRIDSLVL